MGSLTCPLCCRTEFPTRRALQQHLLDVLDLLKCPSCAKSFTSILGLVQHLSLSSCNVEVGVNFDEHFVTYVDCSFMKAGNQESKAVSNTELGKPQERPEPTKHIVAEVVNMAPAGCAESEVVLPDDMEVATVEDVSVVMPEGLQGEIICFNLEQGVTGIEVLDGNKILQKTATVSDTAPSQTDTSQDSAKKIAVPNNRKGPQTSKQDPSMMEEKEIDENITYIYQCGVCSCKYNSKAEFDLHECKNFTCDLCGTIRKTMHALKLHKKLHEREDIERKMNEPSTETFVCDECGETIGSNMAEVHMRSHTSGLKTFSCKLCSNTYLSMSKLNDHLKIHGDSRSYHCELCGKDFKTHGYLKAHMETHSEIKRFQCSYCEKTYHRKWDKIKHEYIHTGEKPMECKICGKRFRVHYCLKLHMRTHTNERPYECKTCHKRFKSQAVYSHHIKLHGDARPYKCPHCPKIFKTLVAMTGHKNRHEKPYSCDLCNRRFASKYDVRIHMPIHNNQENKDLFKCVICEAVYARNHALLEHLKEHGSYKTEKNLKTLEDLTKAGRIFSGKDDGKTAEFLDTMEDFFIGQEEEVGGSVHDENDDLDFTN